MRELDRGTRLSRRVFIKGSATAVPAAAIAATTLGASHAWAEDAKALQPATMITLCRMARDIYPHDHIADSHYVKAVQPWDAKASGDPAFKSMMEDGVAQLDANAQAAHGKPYKDVAWEADRVAILRGMEHGAFFRKVRSDLVVSLYNQHDLWAKFGYEGSSADKGGYIHRGFNDIDWLGQV